LGVGLGAAGGGLATGREGSEKDLGDSKSEACRALGSKSAVGLALGSGRDANLDSPLFEGRNDEKLGSEAGPLDAVRSADALDGSLLGSSMHPP